MRNNKTQIDPKALQSTLATVVRFAKKNPRVAILGVLAIVLILAFFSVGKPDKVVGFIDSQYLKVSSQSTNNGSFSVYESDLSPSDVHAQITAASIPREVAHPTGSLSYVLTYPNTTVSLSGLHPEGTKISVDAKIDTETRNSILRMLVYVLAEFGDSLGDMDTSDTPYDNKAPPSKDPSWQVDEPSTGGSGSFIKRDDVDSAPSGGSKGSKDNDTYDIDLNSDTIREPSTTQGEGTFHLRE